MEESSARTQELQSLAAQCVARGDIAAAAEHLRVCASVDETPLAWMVLGELHAARSEWAVAIPALEAAAESARRQSDPRWRAACAHNLATAYRVVGQMHLADRQLQAALRAEMDGWGSPSDVWSAGLLQNCAAQAELDGDASRAIALCAAAGMTAGVADRPQVLMLRGVLAYRSGRMSDALRSLLRGFKLARRGGDLPMAAECLVALAHAFRDVDRPSAAVRCLCGAAELFEQQGDLARAEAARAWAHETRLLARLKPDDAAMN